MSRLKGLDVVGYTTEGQPVVNFFSLLDTYGLPLEVVLETFNREKITPDWTGFFISAVKSGRPPGRVQLQLEEAIGDVYGKQYRERFSLLLDAWKRYFDADGGRR